PGKPITVDVALFQHPAATLPHRDAVVLPLVAHHAAAEARVGPLANGDAGEAIVVDLTHLELPHPAFVDVDPAPLHLSGDLAVLQRRRTARLHLHPGELVVEYLTVLEAAAAVVVDVGAALPAVAQGAAAQQRVAPGADGDGGEAVGEQLALLERPA